MTFTIRKSTADDAAAIGKLAADFARYLRSLGDRTRFRFTPRTYVRDGFGKNPAFYGLVAVAESQVIGYLLYHYGYDTDRASRLMYVADLYVRKNARRKGVGKALMRSAAMLCRNSGVKEMVWAVYAPNRLAAAFYERLGAKYLEHLNFMYMPATQI